MVLSHRVWQQQWGGDPNVIGKTVRARDHGSEEFEAYTIVGVMPLNFRHPAAIEHRFSRLPPTDLWTPLRLEGTPAVDRWSSFSLRAVGRLKGGVHLKQARSEAVTLTASLAHEHPEYYTGRWHEGRSIGMVSLIDRTVGDLRSPIVILFAATALVLVIAAANVTGLFLARVLDQNKELSVRSALGAGRGRIVRQIATETLLLSLLGCVVGILIASAGTQAFRLLAPASFPRLGTISIDLQVVAFACAVAALAGLFCGAVPALLFTQVRSETFLRSGTGVGRRKVTVRLRSTLVTVELALAVVLLIGAALLVNSYVKLYRVDPGVDPEGLLLMPSRLNRDSYASPGQRADFFLDATRRLRRVAGVEGVSWITDPPMTVGNWSTLVFAAGVETDDEAPEILTHPVGPDYFQTMGMPILSGRGITRQDDLAGPSVVVVDELLATRLWPGEDPAGKRLHLSRADQEPVYTVVGVVGGIRQENLAEDQAPQLYIPYLQVHVNTDEMQIVVRTVVPLAELGDQLRSAIWQVDPNLPLPTVEAMESRISESLRLPRFSMLLLGSFALSALVLTIVGVYGLMLYLVRSRTHEIGIRSALGAGPKHVLWAISRRCLLLILVGSIAGIGTAVATSRTLGAFLFAVSPADPLTYCLVAVGLGLTALIACFVPAWRATRVDPTVALRAE